MTPMMKGFAKIIWYSYDLHVKTVDAKTVIIRTTIFADTIRSQGSQFSVYHKLHLKEDLYLDILASNQGAL